MSMGLLPGLVALAPKVLPVLLDYLREVCEQVRGGASHACAIEPRRCRRPHQ